MTESGNVPEQVVRRVPGSDETEEEIRRIIKICKTAKENGREIVAVQGLGFVGAINSAVIADVEKDGDPPYMVIGVDLPTIDSFWKIEMINHGVCPFKSEDPEVDDVFRRSVIERGTLLATWVDEVYRHADLVVVDINLDVEKTGIGEAAASSVNIEPFRKALTVLAENIKPEALVLVETTVPPGTLQNIAKPIFEEGFRRRGMDPGSNPPLLAHSYERVMPGKEYVSSIKRMRRTYSAVSDEAADRARDFLSNLVDTENYPLWRLDKPNASELAKILENSYRAMNIAFIHEWTKLAEDMGVNLFSIIDSIRVRKGTHDNIMYPGFGVGGYCLTKDPLLAQWSSREIFGRDDMLDFSVMAVDVNDLMPGHTFDLLVKGLGGDLSGKRIAVLGASYRKDVDDTRNSPTILLHDLIRERGGEVAIHDPYATEMQQREDIAVHSDIDEVLSGSDSVIFVVNHNFYCGMDMDFLIDRVGSGCVIVDAFNILDDRKITFLKRNGMVVYGVGKGHIKNL
ncbi:MAG: nucleotide sugar dehydrogenase [Thermoplasmatota archaeon]